MSAVTIAFKIPNNLLLILALFFAWTLLGNAVKYYYPKFWNWVENQYLKRHGIPCNNKENFEETAHTYICKLLYFTIELSLVIVFFRAVVLNLMQ